MSKNRIKSALWQWFRITLSSLVIIISIILLLILFLLVFQVPSFEIGYPALWILRWQNSPGVSFSVTWNIKPVLLVSAAIGLVAAVLSLLRPHRTE
jgi:hypothetical protein